MKKFPRELLSGVRVERAVLESKAGNQVEYFFKIFNKARFQTAEHRYVLDIDVIIYLLPPCKSSTRQVWISDRLFASGFETASLIRTRPIFRHVMIPSDLKPEANAHASLSLA